MNLQETSRKTHYHIHWLKKPALDWQAFSTQAEAEDNAKRLALRGESYTIEEQGETCPRCRDMKKSATESE
jgi:hypothetical protein